MTKNDKGRIIYFSHGGGPLPILGDESHQAMIEFMKQLPSRIKKPEAILLVSAHWEENIPTLLGSSYPSMLYDYYGFPEESYSITYPAPGNPDLAGRIARILTKAGIPNKIDNIRGFDHGLYVPLMLMYPAADIPALQLSLVKGLNPAKHVEMGKALRKLMNENILVIGSGFSFHNMEAFSWLPDNLPDPANENFQDWLCETCTGSLSQAEREHRLIDWVLAPSARYCHPREDHLLPLHVCAGMGNGPAKKIFDDFILGKRALAFEWS